ncbi:MAG: M50 family metallopeptidase [Anaerolineae bacterium]|nr:M50 family metallopeptidase [Anaerolineae bacterium]
MEGAELYPQLNFEAALVFLAALLVGVFIAFTPMFYPFDKLFTTIHELGHLLATKLTGGEVKGLWVHFKAKNNSELGATLREGGDDKTIISAGYMGTALFTTILILMSGLPYVAPYTISFRLMCQKCAT